MNEAEVSEKAFAMSLMLSMLIRRTVNAVLAAASAALYKGW
jgi:hypothetical protein